MRIKKTPEADLNNKRTLFTLIGLVLAFGFAYICIEMSDSKVKEINENEMIQTGTDETDLVDNTTQDDEEIEEMPEEQPEEIAEQLDQTLSVVENGKETKGQLNDIKEKLDSIAIPPAPTQNNSDDEDEDEKIIFTKVDKKAEFPGGKEALRKWLAKNLTYPQVAIDNNITGKVMVKFVVSKTGEVKDAKVIREVDPSLDEEAKRVVLSMPKWTPAEQHNKPCNSYYTLPVNFSLKEN